MLDMRISTPCRIICAGASMCGKTYRIFKMIRDAEYIFNNPEEVKNVVYFYNIWGDEFDKNKDLVREWINEKPTKEVLLQKAEEYKKTGCLVIIDDYGNYIDNDMIETFTVFSHHGRLSVIILVQNLFAPNIRELRLNATITLIFKSCVDKTQIVNFAKQFDPEFTSFVRRAYAAATKEKHGYLLVNHQDNILDVYRLYSNICVDQWPPVLYLNLQHSSDC